MKRTKVILLLTLLGLGIGLSGAGQTATTVFDIEPGVTMLGAGGAGLSVANGAETLYYNPANLSELPGISFSSFYSSYVGIANYSALALTFRNWGFAALMLNSGGIQGYDAAGGQTDALSFANTGILFGVGLRPSDLSFLPDMGFDFSVGARIKYVSAAIGESNGSGFAFDLGFRTGFPDMSLGGLRVSDIAIGITAVNMFGSVTYEAESEDFKMDLKLGGSAVLFDSLLVALDMHLGGSIRVGLAYSPMPTLALRLGMISAGILNFTAGVGVNVDGILI
ncbi:hypothetical protein ACFLSF_03740, partial [Candidatus Bipolaricaulota bacterium]